MDTVEDIREVANRARDDEFRHTSAPGFADLGAEGDAAARGLKARDAAGAGGIANRAAAVTGVGDGDHPRSDRRGRAAGGAADDAARVPGIAGRAEGIGLGRRREAELRRIGLADEQEARAAKARRQLAVVRGDPLAIAEHAGAPVLGRAGEGRPEILQQDRHPSKSTVTELAPRDLFARRVEERDHDGVELRVDALDRGDRLLEQLRGRARFRTDQLGLAGGVEIGDARHAWLPWFGSTGRT